MRCMKGIISRNITTFYNNFEFPNFLVFVIDNIDVKTLKDNIKTIKGLFNDILVLDSNEYELVAYYLMPFDNHFVVIFKSQLSVDMIKNEKWYLFDYFHDVIFEIIGDLDKVLKDFGIRAVIYKKN